MIQYLYPLVNTQAKDKLDQNWPTQDFQEAGI